MTGTLSTPETTQMPWEPDTSLLDAARQIAPMIREHSQEAERERRLSQPVLKALRETGLLRMTTPRSLGGLETDPVTRALVGEEIGRHDSAAAWTLENGATNQSFFFQGEKQLTHLQYFITLGEDMYDGEQTALQIQICSVIDRWFEREDRKPQVSDGVID